MRETVQPARLASPRAPAVVVRVVGSLAAQPGSRVQYCCAGYILLGQLLECLYGQPLNELAVQEVFWPLKMKNTA